jgi:hypothetical protein
VRNHFLRIVTDCLPSIILAGSAGILTVTVWQVGAVVGISKSVHVLEEVIVAAAAAEEAAFDAAARDLATDEVLQVQSSTGMLCSVSPSSSAEGTSNLVVEVRGRNQRYYSYSCELLAGAAPRALGYPLSVRSSVLDARKDLRAWLAGQADLRLDRMNDDTDLPRLKNEAQQAVSPYAAAWAGLRRDDSLALLRTPSGTDLRDHVFAVDKEGICRPRVPESGTILLAGHLWVDRGPQAVVIELPRSLTLVARGNIYIGRSLVVRGPGKLTLVALRGDSELFADRNTDGRWSAGDDLLTGDHYRGPVEGTGAIYLGLPAQPEATESVVVGASLHAQGEVHLLAGRSEIQGALVVGQGLTRSGKADLVLPGTRLPNTQRERVPGFQRHGGRRPSLLTPSQ